MRTRRLWARLFGVERAVVEEVYEDSEDGTDPAVVVRVRPRVRARDRCSHCHVKCGRYDHGGGLRRWRAPDLGTLMAYVEAEAPRVRCAVHGVVVAWAPWARTAARCTTNFDDEVAWLVTHTDRTTVSEFARVTWRTVGRIVERVSEEAAAKIDRFQGLVRIGIDEISYRKGHRYLTVVVDHDTGRLLWAAPGRDEQTLSAFFELLGPERSARIKLVSADGATWIKNVVEARCPTAKLCMDPFHVVKWATDALDDVRRMVWNNARRQGLDSLAKALKNARFALWKNPEDLTEKQGTTLSVIAQVNAPLYRAYLLKEQLREVFKAQGYAGIALLRAWLAWASRSKIPAFVKVARSIRERKGAIHAALLAGLSNARVESLNTRVRLLTRVAFGFHSPHALIGLAMLKLGGLCPALPGR